MEFFARIPVRDLYASYLRIRNAVNKFNSCGGAQIDSAGANITWVAVHCRGLSGSEAHGFVSVERMMFADSRVRSPGTNSDGARQQMAEPVNITVQPSTTRGPRWSRMAAGSAALLIQALVIAMFALMQPHARNASKSDGLRIEVSFINSDSANPPAPAPMLAMETPMIDLPLPEQPPIEVEAHAGMRGIEPPRVDPTSTLDLESYSARISLPQGQIATVVVLVDVAEDGRVTHALVVRSTGSAAANAAALEYARGLNWIPGRIAGEPRPMQASLTVTLGAAATPPVTPGPSTAAIG